MAISVIKKRDGRIVPFDVQKISDAIQKSFAADEPDRDHEALADTLAWKVYSLLDLEGDPAPTVEHVQDVVEQVLMREGYGQTAKSYILYRQERTNIRNREAAGRGVVTVAPPKGSCSLLGQAFTVYALVRDNGGCEALRGFYGAMAPGVADEYARQYANDLRLALELCAGLRVSEGTLRTIDATLAAAGLTPSLGTNEDYLCRQAALLSSELGCEPAAVEQAQQLAAPRARDLLRLRTRRMIGTMLEFLADAGCPRDRIEPGSDRSAEIRLLQDILRG